ncbi:MAG: glycosyltransferase family 4 protein [bacterium]|nr:MAG: glycosyltransferase family 4 protein [bacterium]
MKIFYIYFHDSRFVPIHVNEILNELQKRDHRIHVFTRVKDEVAKHILFDKRIKIHNLWVPEIRFVAELFFIVLLFPTLFIKALSVKPDILYHRHSASSLAVIIVSMLIRIPCLLEINDIVIDKLKFVKTSILKKIWIKFYHYIGIRLASKVLPVTEQIGLWIRDTYHVRQDKIVVISNGVNIHRFKPEPKDEARQKYKIPVNAKVILSLGSLFPWAGIETLISAAPKIIEAYSDSLFLIGSGEEPYLSDIKNEVKKSGLQNRFLFYGFIPWDEAAWFISLADICVAPIIFKNTRSGCSSLRVYAYLACGKVVVGSNIHGLGDMLEQHKIGASISMGDHLALSKAVISLLSDNKQLKQMEKIARELSVENYSWEIIVNKLEKIFVKLGKPLRNQ